MIYLVLGMHKSGTTLIAELLHKSGVNMVDKYDPKIDYDHLKGKMERTDVLNINHEILGSKGVNSLDISCEMVDHYNSAQETEIKLIISRCQNQYEQWGMKDPRLCLTYGVWHKLLPRHKIIVVYREPSQVMAHYAKSFPFYQKIVKMKQSLGIYNRYNQNIINIISTYQVPYLMIDYNELMNDDNRTLEKISRFIEKPIYDARKKSKYRKIKEKGLLIRILDLFSKDKTIDVYNNLKRYKS